MEPHTSVLVTTSLAQDYIVGRVAFLEVGALAPQLFVEVIKLYLF